MRLFRNVAEGQVLFLGVPDRPLGEGKSVRQGFEFQILRNNVQETVIADFGCSMVAPKSSTKHSAKLGSASSFSDRELRQRAR